MTREPVTVELSIDASKFEAALDRATGAARRLTVAMCPVCQHYLSRRLRVLAVAVCRTADQTGRDAAEVLNDYAWAVHQRHLEGGSLSTRRHTPTVAVDGGTRVTVQRVCNGCGKSLGDAKPAELDAAQHGDPLPDVTLECGCHGSAAA